MLATTLLETGPFVTVDIETTGCRPGTNGIIEIGAVRIESGLITDRFSTLVRPDEPIPPAIQHLTGIDDAMVASAPDIVTVMTLFREFTRDAVLVAHNHRFDMGFLDFEAERCWGAPFPRPVLDTLALARRLHPELPRHNLRVLAEFYGASSLPNHRAFPDALATAHILQQMFAELSHMGLVTAGDVAGLCGLPRQGALARKLTLATHLPDCPGVYLFRDEGGRVVFVGRAKNLRTRARSHFYAPAELGSAHPGAAAASIDHVVCVSPLDALLLEHRLIARYEPTFNRHTRSKQPLYIHVSTAEEFPALRVTRRLLKSGMLYGPLSNEWAARTVVQALARHFGLRQCAGPLSARVRRPCPRRDIGSCPQPCLGAVEPDTYARRLQAALGVLDGEPSRFRSALQRLRDQAASDQRYEDAIQYRDAVRALDRTLSALGVVERARREPVCVLVEGDPTGAVAHVLVHGSRMAAVRMTRAEIADPAHVERLQRVLARASARATEAARMTPRRLREVLLVDSYRQQHAPIEIPVNGDARAAAAAVSNALRRTVRAPRKRHAAAADV